MDIKKLKTTELLDELRDADDEEWGEIFEELNERVPFDYLNEQIDELKVLIGEQKEGIRKLRNSMREHAHLPNGKSIIEI